MTNEQIKADLFYIQNRGYCGNCMFWWRADGKGYTLDLDQAWKVTKEQSGKLCRPGIDRAWPVSLVEAAMRRHVSIELLRSLEREPTSPIVTPADARPDTEQEIEANRQMLERER